MAAQDYKPSFLKNVRLNLVFTLAALLVAGVSLSTYISWTIMHENKITSSRVWCIHGQSDTTYRRFVDDFFDGGDAEIVASISDIIDSFKDSNFASLKASTIKLAQILQVKDDGLFPDVHVDNPKRIQESDEVSVLGFDSLADPLDDHCTLDGHPDQPLTIETAHLCDPVMQPQLKSSWKCDEDTTCRACKTESIERYLQIQKVFREKNTQEKRTIHIREKFPAGSTVVVSAVNTGQLYLFMNWVCSCEKIGLNPREFTYVIPADPKAFKYLKGQGFLVPDSDYLDMLSFKIPSSYKGAANMGGHADINNLLLLATVDMVELGYYTLLHDVDMIWNRNPIPYLMRVIQRRDFVAMLAPRYDAQGPVNSGFVFIGPTKKSQLLMKTLENLSGLKRKRDQILWNSVIRLTQISGQIAWRILPKELFRKTGISHLLGMKHAVSPLCLTPPPQTGDYLVFHAVGNSKKSSIMKQGHWYFVNGVCQNRSCTENCGPEIDSDFLDRK